MTALLLLELEAWSTETAHGPGGGWNVNPLLGLQKQALEFLGRESRAG